MLLETVREIAGGTARWAGAFTAEGEAEASLKAIPAAMRADVELLAREWSEDYPAGAAQRPVVG
jgi:hypothetical protein